MKDQIGFWEWLCTGIINTVRDARVPRRGELVYLGMFMLLASVFLSILSIWLFLLLPLGILVSAYGIYQEDMLEAERELERKHE